VGHAQAQDCERAHRGTARSGDPPQQRKSAGSAHPRQTPDGGNAYTFGEPGRVDRSILGEQERLVLRNEAGPARAPHETMARARKDASPGPVANAKRGSAAFWFWT